MKTNQIVRRLDGKKNKIKVILNVTGVRLALQDLSRMLLPLRKNNDLSGRFRIKYGMTFFNTVATAASGFTLIELLVVVLIIGILAAVAVPQYQRAVVRARYQQAVAFGDMFLKAQELYFLENGQYSTNFNELAISIPPTRQENAGNTFYYPWGYCQLRSLEPDPPDMNCYMDNAPRFQIHFYKATGWTRSCFGGAENATFNAVCRAETGKTEPDYKHPSAGWWSWNY